jgi:hypothetical protein
MPCKFDETDTSIKNGRLVRERRPFPNGLKRKLERSYNFELPLAISICVRRTNLACFDWDLYKRWFDPQGEANQPNVEFVCSVFSALYDWTTPDSTKTLHFFFADQNEVEKRNPTMAAYCSTLGAEPGVAHVGSGVRIGFSHMANIFQEWDLAGFICHELAHKLGKQLGRDIVDHGYGKDLCLGFARDTPVKATANADNYRCYLKEANRRDFLGQM